MRMHALMGASPVVNRSAIANSTTPIDLSLLVRATDGQVSELNSKLLNLY